MEEDFHFPTDYFLFRFRWWWPGMDLFCQLKFWFFCMSFQRRPYGRALHVLSVLILTQGPRSYLITSYLCTPLYWPVNCAVEKWVIFATKQWKSVLGDTLCFAWSISLLGGSCWSLLPLGGVLWINFAKIIPFLFFVEKEYRIKEVWKFWEGPWEGTRNSLGVCG